MIVILALVIQHAGRILLTILSCVALLCCPEWPHHLSQS